MNCVNIRMHGATIKICKDLFIDVEIPCEDNTNTAKPPCLGIMVLLID